MNQFKIKKGLIVNGDGGTILDVQGSNGELFSVNDNFSGILFSVNNISGLPIMTVSSDNSIVMGQFGLNVLTLTGNSVGIGTASPTANLHVVGNARVTGAILDSTNAPGTSGQVLTSTVTGTDWKSLAEISGVDGTGTANYLSKWADADTITNSIVYDNGTNVGIGTATPNNKLTVNGNIETTGAGKIGFNVNDSYGSFPHYGLGYAGGANITNLAGYFGLSFGTNGTERMRITGTGNVGIGTTAPNAKLQVNYGATEAGVYISGTSGDTWLPYTNGINYIRGELIVGDNAATNVQLVTGGGNVGIGTTAPKTKLQVGEFGNGNGDVTLFSNSGGIHQGSSLTWNMFTSGGNSNSIISKIQPDVYNPSRAYLNALDFYVGTWNNNADVGTAKMSIVENGNVGIGTTSPVTGLDVRTSPYSNTTARFGATRPIYIVNDDPIIGFNQYYDSGWKAGASGWSGNVGLNTSGDIYFNTSTASVAANAAVTNNLRMTILNTGNVGIGTTSPFNKLTVGSVSASGYGLITISSDWASGSAISTGIKIGAAADSGGAGVDIRSHSNYAASSGTEMSLWTNSTSNVITERMRITSAGNVGIGTTAPGTKLQVAGTIRATGTTGIVDVDPLYGAFRFYNGSTFYGGFYNDAVLSAGNAVDLVSYVATGDYYIGSATTAKAVKVEQGGNVGIGTTSPTEKLDVSGAVNATSYSVGGTAGFTGTVVFASNPPGSQMLDFQGGLLVSVS